MHPICAHLLSPSDPLNPILLPNAVPDPFCSEPDLHTIFTGIQAEIAAQGTDSPYRVYIDGMLSLEHADRLARSTPAPGESTQQWITRILEARQCGIVLNHAERWADAVTRRAVKLFAPLAQQWGAAETAFELILFAGNYGYTPFGIHIDDPYTQTVHFQLSGDGKSMTLYTPDAYQQFAQGAQRYFPAQALPDGGTTYPMPPGSVFLLPTGWYHVGTNTGFSLGIAAAISHFSPTHAALQAMRDALHTPPAWLDQTQPDITTCTQWMHTALDELTAVQTSKACFTRAVMRRPFALELDDPIAPDPDFPTQVLIQGIRLLIFCRGHRIETGMQPAKLRILQSFLCLTSCTPRILLQNEPESRPAAILALLREMGACGAVHHVPLAISNPAITVQASASALRLTL